MDHIGNPDLGPVLFELPWSRLVDLVEVSWLAEVAREVDHVLSWDFPKNPLKDFKYYSTSYIKDQVKHEIRAGHPIL